jgi:hydrogenase-4 component F
MSGQARALLLFFGLLSIGTAMVFIPSQRDIKRFLAYSSIEHIGVIATGVGLGGIGVTIALFHTLNHSFAKMLAFFSAGKLVQSHNTHDMDKIHGAIVSNRMWGTGFFLSTLALIGAAPFAIFMSELQILKTGFDQGRYVTLAYLLFAIAVIFIAAFKHIMKVTFGTSVLEKSIKSSLSDKLIVFSCLGVLVVFGFYMPDWLWNILDAAANSIGK